MATVAVLLGEMFEDVEYRKPARAFREAGHRLVLVGKQEGAEVTGKTGGTKERIERAAKDVTAGDFDALLIPGGYSPDHLRTDRDVLDFTRRFVESGKPVFAICHAPQLLISAGVLEGRRVAGWKSIVQDVKNAGAVYEDREVVEDGNLISSREPSDIPAFIDTALRRLNEVYGGQPVGRR